MRSAGDDGVVDGQSQPGEGTGLPFDPGHRDRLSEASHPRPRAGPELGAAALRPRAGSRLRRPPRTQGSEKRRSRARSAPAGSESAKARAERDRSMRESADRRGSEAARPRARAPPRQPRWSAEPLIELDEPAEVETGGPAPVSERRGLRPRAALAGRAARARARRTRAPGARAPRLASSASESSESVRSASAGATPARARGTPAARSRGVRRKRREQRRGGKRRQSAARPASSRSAPDASRAGTPDRPPPRARLADREGGDCAVSVVLGLAAALGRCSGCPFPGLDDEHGPGSLASSATLFGVDSGHRRPACTGATSSRSAARAPHDYGEAAAKFGAPRSGHMHEGQDIFAKPGTPLVAVHDGIVIDGGGGKSFYAYGGGNSLVIYSPLDDRSYVYLHMLKPSPVLAGDDRPRRAGRRPGRLHRLLRRAAPPLRGPGRQGRPTGTRRSRSTRCLTCGSGRRLGTG